VNEHQKLKEMIEGFDTAMLVTHHPSHGIDARPMAIADIDAEGGIWFITDNRSGKIVDLKNDSQVALTMQGGKQFISISGLASIQQNRRKIDQLWNEAWKVWFPDGKDDPALTLLHVIPDRGEYWDNSGFQGVRYLFKAGKAYLEGERPEIPADQHSKVKL
jgi:general stress protein 26